MRGKLEIKLNGEAYSLWFNNYATIEYTKRILARFDGVTVKEKGKERNLTLIEAVEKLNEENEFILLGEMIWAGICGNKHAKDIPYPLERQKVFELVGVADMETLSEVSKAFFEAMGEGLETEKTTKKKKSKN